MTRPVTVDLELSHLSEENRWEVSNTEEYIKTLEVEVERLRETEKKLREIGHSLKDDNANYFSRNLELEQERDQLRERLTHTQKFLATGIHYTYQQLAEHDAEVIERAINECAYKTLEGDIINVECIREHANQVRQQVKEVQT